MNLLLHHLSKSLGHFFSQERPTEPFFEGLHEPYFKKPSEPFFERLSSEMLEHEVVPKLDLASTLSLSFVSFGIYTLLTKPKNSKLRQHLDEDSIHHPSVGIFVACAANSHWTLFDYFSRELKRSLGTLSAGDFKAILISLIPSRNLELMEKFGAYYGRSLPPSFPSYEYAGVFEEEDSAEAFGAEGDFEYWQKCCKFVGCSDGVYNRSLFHFLHGMLLARKFTEATRLVESATLPDNHHLHIAMSNYYCEVQYATLVAMAICTPSETLLSSRHQCLKSSYNSISVA